MLWVYSDSLHWKDYCEQNIHPRIRDHATLLNWSQRKLWWHRNALAVRIFKHWSGVTGHQSGGKQRYSGRNFNPLAVIFLPKSEPVVLQFYPAFKQMKKRGLRIELDKLERRLDELILAIEEHKSRTAPTVSTSP